MKTFKQFIETDLVSITEEKIKIRGNLCHEFGKFTPCTTKSDVQTKTVSRRALTKDVIKEVVQDLKRNGSVIIDEAAQDYLLAKKIRPDDLLKNVIGMDATKKHKGELTISMEGDNLTIDATNVTHHSTGAKILRCMRTIDTKRNIVDHRLLTLAAGDQGANTVKELFKTALPTYDKLGLKKITLHANLTAGGYAWAKYGFEPEDVTDNYDGIYEIAERGQPRLDNFLKDIEQANGKKMSPEALKEYESVKKMLKPEGLELSLIQKVANLKTKHLDEFIDSNKQHRKFGIDETDEENYIPPHVKMTTAKLLLYNRSWFGELYLKGSSRRKIKAYINQ